MHLAASEPMLRVAVCVCTCDRATLLARVLQVVERIELGQLRPQKFH